MTSKIEAIIFDLDGVFVDSFACIYDAYNYMFKKLKLPQFNSLYEFKKVFSVDFRNNYADFGIQGKHLENKADEFVQKYLNKNYLETPIFNDMVEVVKKLDIKIGMATSGYEPLVEIKLKKMGLFERMESIIGRLSVKKLKPDPEPLWACATELKVPIEKTAFIGDTTVDIEAGKAAGVAKTIGISGGFESIEKLVKGKPDIMLLRKNDQIYGNSDIVWLKIEDLSLIL